MNQIIIAIDPGREKCGIAVVHQQQGVLSQQVIQTAQLKLVVQQLIVDHNVNVIVMGDGTSSKQAKQALESMIIANQSLTITLVDERHSTDQARCLYWRKHPPQGFMRLIPVTMQVPPNPVDDYVAVILAERYFAKK